MQDTISQPDREFLQELHDLGAATIPQLCDLQGVTTTAIRQRLTRLQAAGLISRQTIRSQRGRPYHEYQLTVDGQKLLGDNYAELATVLWSQLSCLPDLGLKQRILDQVRDALIQKYGENIKAIEPAERLQQLQNVLLQHGFSVEVDVESAPLVLMERNCPYHDLALHDRSICDLEQQVFGQIVGVQLQLTQRCVDGHACCRFELSPQALESK